MAVVIDGVRYPSSANHAGAAWRGWTIRKTLQPRSPVPANENVPVRYRGGYPALTWLAKRDPAGAAAIHALVASDIPTYYNRGGADDGGSWEGDALDSPDDRLRIVPDIDDLIVATGDGQAVRPHGRLVAMAGPLRSGFPASEKPYRISGNWYRHGRAVFIVESVPHRQGLLAFWLANNGTVQLPREERAQRSGSNIPTDWRVERYMRQWEKRPRNDRDATLAALYEAECRDFHLRRRGAAMPMQIHGPAGHNRTEIPEDKAVLRAWLVATTEGHKVTRLPDGCARTDWLGRVPGRKHGTSVPEVWRPTDLIELPDDVALTVETVLSRGTLADVAAAHGVTTLRSDRTGKKLVLAAASKVLAANDNKKTKKIAA